MRVCQNRNRCTGRFVKRSTKHTIKTCFTRGKHRGARVQRGSRGHRYPAAEWPDFFSAGNATPAMYKRAAAFTDRVQALMAKHAAVLHRAGWREDDDEDRTAYLTFASLTEQGVGLWEREEPWHETLDKLVRKDAKLASIATRLDNDFSLAQEG